MASNAPPPPFPPPPPPPSNLEITIRKCIPKELIPETWKCDKTDLKSNIAALLEGDGKLKLGIFDSADELYDTVVSYMNFPKDDEHFKLDRSTKTERYPNVPRSVGNKWCIYKNDLYKIFDYHKFSPLEGNALKLSEVMLEDCWESVRVKSHHEMVLCPYEPILPSFEETQIATLFSPVAGSDVAIGLNFKEMARDQIDTVKEVMFNSMDKFYDTWPPRNNAESSKVILWTGYIVGKAGRFAKRGLIHMPPLHFIYSTDEPTEVIRVFSFDKNHFVMAHELFEFLKKNRMDSKKLEKMIPEELRQKTLSTLPYGKVLEEIKNDNQYLKKLEYAKMKIDLLMFNQTPIPYEGGYCILAADALYEILMDMVMAKKVFQTIVEDDWWQIDRFFGRMRPHFDYSREIYFIDSKEVDAIKQDWENVYNTHLKKSQKPIQMKKDKLDINSLVRTLKSLKLDKCFGDIEEFAYSVYPGLEFKRMREKKRLSHGDMVLAVAQCQFNSLARRYLWIFYFCEHQKSRDRLNIVDLPLALEKYDVDEVAAKFDKMKTKEVKPESKGSSGSKTKNQNKKK